MAEEEKVEKAPVKKTAAKKKQPVPRLLPPKLRLLKTTTRKTTKKAAETAEAPVEKKTTAKKATKKAAPKAKGECKKAAVVSRVEVDYKERVVAEPSLKNSVTSRSWKSHTLKRLLSIWVLEKLQATPKLSKKQWLI